MISYFPAAASVFTGVITVPTVLTLLGTIALIAGLVLALRWRERRALWLLIPLGLAALTAPVMDFMVGFLGWLGASFAMLGGALALVLLVTWIAYDATRRLPIWLIGAFTFTLALFQFWPFLIRYFAI
ncbi:MAG: hypothetical protein JWR75_988 [Devosia sp.]|nr:hypothetical protein [Devosia sp.]